MSEKICKFYVVNVCIFIYYSNMFKLSRGFIYTVGGVIVGAFGGYGFGKNRDNE